METHSFDHVLDNNNYYMLFMCFNICSKGVKQIVVVTLQSHLHLYPNVDFLYIMQHTHIGLSIYNGIFLAELFHCLVVLSSMNTPIECNVMIFHSNS